MHSDEALMATVARGDHDALRTLYNRHASVMLRLIRRLTANAGVAEEILQEAWVAVWRSAGSFRGEASVRSWLLGVTRRQAHNQLRRAGVPLVDIDEVPEIADPASSVEDQVLRGAQQQDLVAAVHALPEHLREVLILALVEELPYRDIATTLEIPVGTVKSRMSHARRRLAAAFASAGVERVERS